MNSFVILDDYCSEVAAPANTERMVSFSDTDANAAPLLYVSEIGRGSSNSNSNSSGVGNITSSSNISMTSLRDNTDARSAMADERKVIGIRGEKTISVVRCLNKIDVYFVSSNKTKIDKKNQKHTLRLLTSCWLLIEALVLVENYY